MKTARLEKRKFWEEAVASAMLVLLCPLLIFTPDNSSLSIWADRTTTGNSTEPIAKHLERIGDYKDRSGNILYASQQGEILEYRVWASPEQGGEPLNGSRPYFYAFAQYEVAKQFSERLRGSSLPVAVRIENGGQVERQILETTKVASETQENDQVAGALNR